MKHWSKWVGCLNPLRPFKYVYIMVQRYISMERIITMSVLCSVYSYVWLLVHRLINMTWNGTVRDNFYTNPRRGWVNIHLLWYCKSLQFFPLSISWDANLRLATDSGHCQHWVMVCGTIPNRLAGTGAFFNCYSTIARTLAYAEFSIKIPDSEVNKWYDFKEQK